MSKRNFDNKLKQAKVLVDKRRGRIDGRSQYAISRELKHLNNSLYLNNTGVMEMVIMFRSKMVHIKCKTSFSEYANLQSNFVYMKYSGIRL